MLGPHTQAFPLPTEQVWEILLLAVKAHGWDIEREDRLLKRLSVKTGIGWTSWGQTATITIEDKGAASLLEWSARASGLAAAFGKDNEIHRSRKDFDKLITKMSDLLVKKQAG